MGIFFPIFPEDRKLLPWSSWKLVAENWFFVSPPAGCDVGATWNEDSRTNGRSVAKLENAAIC